jgi:meckelin
MSANVLLVTLLCCLRCCSVDIFFLDWEKPRRILAKGGGREEPGPVSAWRGLLVANEWNELQTARLTNPSFTLIFMVSKTM